MYSDRQEGDRRYAKQVLGTTEQAMARTAAIAHEELKHGLNTIATLTCLAPFIGVLGTLSAIAFDTFIVAPDS